VIVAILVGDQSVIGFPNLLSQKECLGDD